MSYRCPVCRNFVRDTTDAISKHMVESPDNYVEHIDWIKSHKIDYGKMIIDGNYAPLMAAIEENCKIDN